MARHASGSSLMDLISGACVRITAPVPRILRTAAATTAGSSSRGWEKCDMSASVRPEAATSANRRSVASASGSVTNRWGQYESDLVPILIDSRCSRRGSKSGSMYRRRTASPITMGSPPVISTLVTSGCSPR